MKAYEASGTTVQVMDEDVATAPGSIPVKKGDIITLYEPDGMYCHGKNASGERIYIAAWTEVRLEPNSENIH